MGNVFNESFKEMTLDNGKRFLEKQKAYNSKCLGCRYGRICRGGCRRQNVCYLDEDYCGHEELLDCIIPQITELMNRSK